MKISPTGAISPHSDAVAEDAGYIEPSDHSHEVWHLARRALLTCAPNTPLQDVVRQMFEGNCSAVVIVEDGRLLGIWTERDATRLAACPQELQSPVSDHMSSPVKTLAAGSSLREAGLVMQREGVRHLVIVDADGHPGGMFSLSDLIRHQGVEYYLSLREIDSTITREPMRVAATSPAQAVFERMHREQREAFLVDHGDGHCSIACERDWVAYLSQPETQLAIGELAQEACLTVALGTPLLMARNCMEQAGLNHLGVTNGGGEIIALLCYSDILRSIEYLYVSRLQSVLDQRNQALKESTECLRLAEKVIEASLNAIIITDPKGVIQAVNPSFSAVTGYSAEEAIGKTPALLSSGFHDHTFYAAMWKELLAQGTWQGEIWNQRKNGEIYPQWISITAIYDDTSHVRQYAAIFSDISERKIREQQIEKLAYFDELTGLPNRRLFQARLERALEKARLEHQRLGVLFLDLDRFKRINDSLGHSVGDEVLSIVAKRLTRVLRKNDTAARLSGDEFTLLIPAIENSASLNHLAERILQTMSDPFVIDGQSLHLSCSIGIACYPDDGDSVELLLKRADTAMYRSKDNGRNGFSLFRHPLEEASQASLSLEMAMYQALKHGDFELHYQPKLHFANQQPVGLEALIRWPGPDGMRKPEVFLPLAKQLGLMPRITRWVLETACHQLQRWLTHDGPHLPIAVNLSASDLLDTTLVDDIRSLLDYYQIPPQLLDLEITEDSFIPAQAASVQEGLAQLRALGVGVALDDFGTGFCCLGYLKHLPVDYLKIDASFVAGLPEVYEDRHLAQTIIALAHGLNLSVIAEGVENPAQQAFLAEAGCDQYQGYLIAPAMNALDCARWLSCYPGNGDPGLTPPLAG
ncbi:EAL domain-containing protein [Pokkaliibacter sp. CJK22405]|uniref:EAL domain-containing protein n=1 Tax=Pokkaliibacter sp. CJK22405 TaxID=3384615 RepID=UPI0039852F34